VLGDCWSQSSEAEQNSWMRAQRYARCSHTMVAFLVVWLLLTGVLGPAAALADEGHQAGLVVRMEDGQVLTRCISFREDELTGAELLTRSDLEVILDPAGFMGITICQIEGEGCTFPEEPCFCQCMGGGECAYWNYYYRDSGEDDWVYSALGAALHRARDGSVEAWVWGDGRTPPDDALTFAAICAPPTPVPTPTQADPTHLPPTATATIAQAPALTRSPTAAPSPTTPPTATPSPAPSPSTTASATPSLAGYAPFALMVLALAGVGVLVWVRRTRPRSRD
jgi:hypothetical protein